ncbi:MAG: hypothetical protein IPM25_17085 [Chloracidobacterium sp.]|nr:hypothetical protein [Chloracidobacterium sp.]
MRKLLLPLTLLTIFVLPAAGQVLVDDRNITINSQADVQKKRQELIEFVWGGTGLPARRMPEVLVKGDLSPIPGLSDLHRVDTLKVSMEAGVSSYAHHFIPQISNGRLVVLHLGHIPTFDDSELPADVGYGMRRTIEGLLGDGYSVLAVYMPRNAQFLTSIEVSDDGGLEAHNEFFESPDLKPAKGSPLKYFLEPIAIYLNYMGARPHSDDFPFYTEFSMVGFSGGGWTTTVYSAIDERIRSSISIAGSIPLYLRVGAEIGDAEQTIPGFYSIAGYPDLYVMASNGPGRKQIQVLNRHDWCCFSELFHHPELAGGLTYDEAIREYELKVRETLIGLGNKDLFAVEVDEAAPGHNVTWDAIYDTILPELNKSRRYVSTSTGDEAAARGLDGAPAVFLNGLWSFGKLPTMTGTPAILRGTSIIDMFFRTAANQLVHVSRPPAIWSRPRVLADDVISDPAAVTRKQGSYDVVVLGNDYFFYHIRQEGAENTKEVVSTDVKGLGQPTLIASENDQLDLFYRSWNRRLYHARKLGAEPWEIFEVGGRMTDIPTAVRMPDGSYRAFVRGHDGYLWEVRRTPGRRGTWGTWASLGWAFGESRIEGSPSAAVVGGVLNVYARSAGGGILQFTYDETWSLTHHHIDGIGAPTASPLGAFMKTAGGSLAHSGGEDWTELGGLLD